MKRLWLGLACVGAIAPAMADNLPLFGVAQGGGAAGFPFAALGFTDGAGDSRIYNAIQAHASGASLLTQTSITAGYYQWAMLASKNNILPGPSSARGIGATTSLNLYDRIMSATASNNPSTNVPVATQTGGTGAETLTSATAGNGGFAGYLTPGSYQSPGLVTVTFGTANSVNSSCAAGAGYTPFTVTDSNADTIPGSCVQDAINATKDFGGFNAGTYTSRNTTTGGAWANFRVTQPAAGQRAGVGDVFTFPTFGPQRRAYSVTGTAAGNAVDGQGETETPGTTTATATTSNAVLLIDEVNDSGKPGFATPSGGSAYGQCPGPDYIGSYPSILVAAPCLTMVNIAKMLDMYASKNSTVFLTDGQPRGLATAYMEPKVVAAACAGTITPTNTVVYTGDSFATTNGLGQTVSNLPGLIGNPTGGAYTIYTQVGSAPAVGQYRLVGGNYTINTSDPLCTTGGNAYLTYAWFVAATDSYADTIHMWLASNSANFTYNGTAYNFPGALYNRPNVISVPLFEALVDARGGNWVPGDDCHVNPCLVVPGALDSLAVHPTPFGGNLFGNALATALAAVPQYAGLTDNTQLPAWDNIRCARQTSTTLVFSCTMPTSMGAGGHPHVVLQYTKGGVARQITEAAGAFVDTFGDLASSSVNYGTGAVSVTFAAGHAPTNPSYLGLFEDTTNLMNNPLLDPQASIGYAADTVAVCAGTTGITNMPAGWSCTATNSAGLTITWSTGTNSDGYPTLTATITGVATAAGTLALITNSYNDANFYNQSNLTTRAGMQQTFSQNSGSFFNIYGAPVTNSGNAAFTIPNYYTIAGSTANLTSFTSFTTRTGMLPATAGTVSLNDQAFGITGQASGLTLNLLSSPTNLTGVTVTAGQSFQAVVGWLAGPVNGKITFSRAFNRIRN